ncbi:MAG: hypothetical protein AAGJ35_02365, partial [Myxococcota bacterium]
MATFVFVLQIFLQSFLLYAGGTILFDAVHWLLHQWSQSRFRLLRFFASLHQAHHDFLTTSLQFDDRHLWRNMMLHQIPEFLTQITFALCGLWLLSPWAVGVTI